MKRPFLFLPACAALLLAAHSATPGAVEKPAVLDADLAKKSPFTMAGQLLFRSGDSHYEGSGTVVAAHSVLTAAHNVWDATNGWSTEIRFDRAHSGAARASRQYASRLFIFGAYRTAAARYGVDSDRSFASDLGGLRFTVAPAGGAHAGWRADAHLLAGGAPVLCLGYGAEFHSGDDLLAVRSAVGFASVNGAFMESTALTFESGMSGGPIFSEVAPDDLRIVAIVVAGSDSPPAGGIRALDAAGADFLATYLRD